MVTFAFVFTINARLGMLWLRGEFVHSIIFESKILLPSLSFVLFGIANLIVKHIHVFQRLCSILYTLFDLVEEGGADA